MDEKRDTLADASEKLRLGILTAIRGLDEFAKAVQQSKRNWSATAARLYLRARTPREQWPETIDLPGAHHPPEVPPWMPPALSRCPGR